MSARRRSLAACGLGLALLALAGTAIAAGSRFGRSPGLDNPVLRPGDHAAYASGEIIVKFRNRLPLDGAAKASGAPEVDALLQKHAVESIERVSRRAQPPSKPGMPDLTRVYVVRYLDGADALEVALEFAALPPVEYAEPRFIYSIDLVPDDPNYGSQSTYLNRMKFPNAWDYYTGGMGSVVIAIADGGTDWDHADLLANVWNNADEIDGNSIDDDGNGFVDDIRGWNFANGTNDPTGLPATPNSANHGTHVAGICCAVANNATSIAGASYNAKYMPICTAHPTSDNAIAYGYDGIIYAADNDADIVNCSWGGAGSPSAFEQEVIDYAYTNGTVVVAAAGNTGTEVNHYPSAYERVLAVANVTNTDVRNTSTTYGIWVDVSAQGTSILSTLNGGGLGYLTGTSMSSPHAAAACALVKTKYTAYSPEQVMQRVRVTSDPIDNLNPTAYKGKMGYGRINALNALNKNTPAVSVTSNNFSTSDGDGIIEPGETVTVNIDVTNWLASCTGLTFKLRENSVNTTMVDSAAALASLDSLATATLTPFTFSVSPSAPIQHTVLFTLAITTTTPAYTDKSRFELTVLPVFATHDANNIDCSVTSVGKLGYALTAGGTGKDGLGFRFAGSTSYLFEGGLMIGTGVATVSDGCRTTGTAQDDDFQTVTNGIPVVSEPHPPYAEYGVATFTDALAASPLGINVRQESFEWLNPPHDDFIVLKYRIRNDSGVARTGMFVGWFCDWDIDSGSYATNVTGYDATRGVMYAYDSGTSGPDDYVGIMTLTAPGTTAARGIVNDQNIAPDWGVYDAYTDAEKWQTLSTLGATHTTVGPTDVSVGLATGPFDVAAGDSIVVAFAFLAGTDLADLQANADSAQTLWNGITSDAGDDPVADAAPRPLRLGQNAPNPFNPTTTIAFDLPRSTHVRLGIYAVDGRLVRTLLDERRSAGAHRVTWDGRDNAGRKQASGTYLYRFTVEGRTLVRKMSLLK
jgi:hypothetical protein